MKKIILVLMLFAVAVKPDVLEAQTSSRQFSISDRGGATFTTAGDRSSLAVGYARMTSTSGTTPSGVAVYGLRQSGVLVSETGVAATLPMQSVRVFAEESTNVHTGVAIANPNNVTATINFSFTDAAGSNFGASSFVILANSQMARFLYESPFNSGTSLQGTVTITSSVPVGITALRGLINARGEFLITTLPVVDTTATIPGPLSVLSHFADGAGWKTQVVLVNNSDTTTKTGTVVFFNQGVTFGSANPVSMTVNGQGGLSFNYSIPPRGAVKLATSGLGTTLVVGSVRINADPNQSMPSAIGIFSYPQVNVTVSEAGVPAIAGTASLRLFAETSSAGNTAGTIQTGIAVSNLGSGSASVNFRLYRLDGSDTGLTASKQVAGNGQVAAFFHELFPTVTLPFQGVVQISSTGPDISAVGLRARYNERGDFLITTTPPTRETATASAAEVVFPHIVDSDGYTTQFIIYSGVSGQTSAGSINLVTQSGGALALNFR
jgi:hypothetical protein